MNIKLKRIKIDRFYLYYILITVRNLFQSDHQFIIQNGKRQKKSLLLWLYCGLTLQKKLKISFTFLFRFFSSQMWSQMEESGKNLSMKVTIEFTYFHYFNSLLLIMFHCVILSLCKRSADALMLDWFSGIPKIEIFFF